MINFIAKHWIPDYRKYQDKRVRQQYGILCGIVGIFLNILLFVGKLFVGGLSHSIAIMADAFNNLSDAGSSLILLFGFRLAGQKPDPEHPFGHGRLEYVAGLIVSMIIMVMAVELMRSSGQKILHPEEVIWHTGTLVMLVVSILVKLYMFTYNRSYGKKIASAAMGATALDSISDAVATFVVLISTVVSHFTGLQIDGVCGMLVGIFIMYAGISAARDTINPLLGQPAEECFVERVHEIVLSRKEILGMHDLVVHNYGPGRTMLSLHAEVPVDGSLVELHEVIDEVEHQISDELDCSAVIHIDPIWAKDEETQKMKKEMEADLKLMDPSLALHDFRVVRCTGHMKLFFDIQEPYSCKIEEKELVKRLQDHVAENHPGVELVVYVDRF
ncbi:cation diffusion facilitator family transporter [Jutongia sp.]|uniref:cation diffusion facilitator family transporter n=1 Tax=Jutongia sp. TaxID=2944204 RepID=UPI00307ADADB